MSSLKRLRVILEPKSSFSGEIDSIKFYGALVNAIAEMYDEAGDFLASLKNGEIRVSSPMPVVKDANNWKYYVFKPFLPMERLNYKDLKKFKRLKFIREELAINVLADGRFENDAISEILRDEYDVGEKYGEVPGVSIGRENSKSQIYYKSVIGYTTYLWLLIEVTGEWESRVISAMRYAGELGISKKRSTGYGHFEVVEVREDERKKGKYAMLLSKYIPKEEELKTFPFEEAFYNVKLIAGYNRFGDSSFIVRALTEGSVYPVKISPDLPAGRVVDVSPNYSIAGVPVVM